MLSQLPEAPVYPQIPIVITEGKGSFVYDENGVAYLDMYAGHAVAATGHCHPKVVEAITEQAARLIFYSNLTPHPTRMALSEKLIALCADNMKAVFLCNSGAEANENALTLARLVTGRQKVISVTGGFHGRSLLALAVCGIDKYRALTSTPDGPLFPHGQVIPLNDIDAATKVIDKTCAAVIIEPVQGLAGCVPATKQYLQALREACDKSGAMLIFDEVQCGTGRCEAFTAGQAIGVAPNMTTLAKGLGGGFPIGAVLMDSVCCESAKPGTLGSTFGGGPLACAAALANIEAIDSELMIENTRVIGTYLQNALGKMKGVINVQGAGLLIGMTLDRPAADAQKMLLKKHCIFTGTSVPAEVLRIMPPLNLTKDLADRFLSALEDVLLEGQS